MGGDPVNYTDPDGRSKEKIIGQAITKIANIGFRGQNGWNNAVRQLASGGTHQKINGRILTESEATTLLKDAKATINRVDQAPPGSAQGTKSSHTYDHINYTTSNG